MRFCNVLRKTAKRIPKRYQELFHKENDHVLNINLCVTLAISFIITLIQRVKTWLFGESNSVSVMYRWFIYDAIDRTLNSATIRPFDLCNFAIWFDPITAVRCLPRGKFVMVWPTFFHGISLGQPKVNKVKDVLPFLKFMKRPQTKLHAHTMRRS